MNEISNKKGFGCYRGSVKKETGRAFGEFIFNGAQKPALVFLDHFTILRSIIQRGACGFLKPR